MKNKLTLQEKKKQYSDFKKNRKKSELESYTKIIREIKKSNIDIKKLLELLNSE